MPNYSHNTLRASSALTVATTEYGTSYEDTRKSGTATATTSNKLVNSAGAFTTAGSNGLVAVGDIIKNTVTGKFALVTAIDSATTLSVSANVFSDTDTYVIYTHHGLKLTDLPPPSELIAILDLTAAATEAGDLLDVYLDTSWDEGETWLNIGHFTQMVGNGGAKRFLMGFKANPIAASNCIPMGTDQSAGAALQVGFGDRIRYRAVSVDATTTGNYSMTYSLALHTKKY